MASTKPNAIGSAQSTAKQSNGASSLPIVEDDDSDWEYEYSTTETEVCAWPDHNIYRRS